MCHNALWRRLGALAIWAVLLAPPAVCQSAQTPISAQAANEIVRTARVAFDLGTAAALRRRQRDRLARSPGDRAALLSLATLNYLTALYDQADSAYVALLRDATPGDAIVTQAWLGRSAVAGTRARYAEADSFTVTALTIARREQDPYATTLALLRLAQFRARTQGVSASLALLTAADSFASRIGPEQMASVACLRAQTRNMASDTLSYADARRGITLISGGPRSRLRSTCLFTLGQHFFRRGSLYSDSAAHYFRLTAAEQTRLQDWAGRAGSYQWLGATLRSAGRYVAAQLAYDSALVDGLRGANASARAWAILGLGGMRADLGDDVGAVRYLTQASALLKEQNDQLGVQNTDLALMDMRIRRGDVTGVEAMLPTTEVTLRRVGDQLARQRILRAQVDVARLRGNRVQARRLAEELWTQYRSDNRTIGVPYALIRGTTALETGDLDAADSLFAIPERKLPSRLLSYALLARSAEVATRRGNLALAEKRLRDAYTAFVEFRSASPEPELRQSAFRTTLVDQVDPDLGVATVLHALATGGRTTAAFELSAARRSRALTDALIRATALSDSGAAPSVGRARAVEAATTETAVRSALSASEALLFYVTGMRQEPTTLFVLTRDRTTAISLPTADSLAPLVSLLRQGIERGMASTALLSQLGATVMAPALPALPAGITRLLVVTDGPLQDLPFDALRLSGGTAVIERFETASLASPGILTVLRGRVERSRSGSVLAFAVDDPQRRSPVNATVLPPLRRATAEARDAASRQRGSLALTGAAAQEAALYARRDVVSTLHIAAHAVIDPAVPSRSAIMLSTGGGHDGNVYAREIDRLRVSAGLVVLSGCRTASAETDGADGLRGFIAPLLLAGTQAVIATQWNLPDRAAAEMMRDMHTHLAAGAEVGTALHLAKRRQLAMGRPPATWAVWQVIGDPAYRATGTTR